MARRVVQRVVNPFNRFFQMEASGGILLIIATVVALFSANSFLSNEYFAVLDLHLTFGIGEGALHKPLIWWINDGLMTVFFFLVGLEIKREIWAGELASFRQASLPIMAAIGGMVLPALLFVLLNMGNEGGNGWGIPMATDIAFSLGILKLLGKRVPLPIKVFLTAFAIVDDIGAVLVIAIFYTASFSMSAMMVVLLLLVVLILLNYFNVRLPLFYLLVGIPMWYFLYKAGIHPTVAGVVAAFTIPARRKIRVRDFTERINTNLLPFGNATKESKVVLTTDQIMAIDNIEQAAEHVQSPLQKLENNLHGLVIYFIMPIFALANAGVVFSGDIGAALTNQLTLSIAAALVFGKAFGVTAFVWMGNKLGISSLPPGITMQHIFGAGLLGGIGFTMALFIANLAFGAETVVLLNNAKIGILVASLIAGVGGYFFLRKVFQNSAENG